MTSSNVTFPKAIRNTMIAAVFAAVAVSASGYLVYRVNALDAQYGKIITDEVYLRSQLKGARTTLTSTRDELTSARNEMGQLKRQNIMTIEKLSQVESDLAAQRNALLDVMAHKEAGSEDLNRVSAQLEAAKRRVEQLQEDEERLNQSLAELREKEAMERERLAKTTAAVQSTNEQLEDGHTELVGLKSARNELQDQVDALGPQVADLEAAKRRVEQLQEDEERLNQSLAELREEEAMERKRLAKATAAVQSTNEQLADGRTELAGLTSAREELQDQVGALGPQVADLEAGKRRVEQLQEDEERLNQSLAELRENEAIERERLAMATAAVQRTKEQLAEGHTELAGLAGQILTHRETVSKLEQNQAKVAADLETKLTETSVTERHAQDAAARLAEASLRLEELNSTANATQVGIVKKQQELATLAARIETAELYIAELGALRQKAATLKETVSQLSAEKNAIEIALPDLEKRSESARVAAESARAAAEAAEAVRARAQAREQALTADISANELQRDALVQERDKLRAENEMMEEILRPLRAEAATLRSNIDGLTTQAQDLRNQVARVRTQLDGILEQQETERERLNQLQTTPPLSQPGNTKED